MAGKAGKAGMAGKAGKAGNQYLFLTSGCTGLEFGTIFILGDFFVIFDNFPNSSDDTCLNNIIG